MLGDWGSVVRGVFALICVGAILGASAATHLSAHVLYWTWGDTGHLLTASVRRELVAKGRREVVRGMEEIA